ncbi:MAG: molecular chaperone TorD family protein [Vicinamibacterales bacterium]
MTPAVGAAPVPDPAIVALLQDAASWRLLGRLFECPTAAWRQDVATLASEVADAELVAAAAGAVAEADEGVYHSVFGPGGPAPPREVSYHDTVELGSVMSALTGAYGAFGYRPALVEAPDHVAVEAGFMAYLRVKQALALLEGDGTHVEITASALEAFRADHLAVYAERLAAILAEAPLEYLQGASRVLARRVGPRPGPKRLPVIQPPDDEDDGGEFDCEA